MSPGRALFSLRRRLLLSLVAILGIVVPLALGGRTTLGHLLSLSATAVAGLLLLQLLKWLLNALRCHLLLQASGLRLRRRKVLGMVMAYDFAAESTPGGLGGPWAGHVFLRRLQLPSAEIAGLGVLVLMLDIAAITALLAWALAASTGPVAGARHWQVLEALGLMLLILSLLWGTLRFRRPLLRLAGHFPGRRRRRRRSLHRAWLRVGRAFDRLPALRGGLLGLLLLLSTGHWLCRLSLVFAAALALGNPVAWTDGLVAQLLGGLAGMLTGLPGGYGGADLTLGTLLLPSLGTEGAASVILVWRLLTFHLTLLLGGLCFLWLMGSGLPAVTGNDAATLRAPPREERRTP